MGWIETFPNKGTILKNFTSKSILIIFISILLIGCEFKVANENTRLSVNPFAHIQDSAVLLAPNIISTASPEFASSWNPELNMLAFNRTSEDRKNIYLYTSTFEQGTWQEPVLFEHMDSSGRDIDPFFHDNQLYFSSTRKRSDANLSKNYDIYSSEWNNNWMHPKQLNDKINTDNHEVFVTISKLNNSFYTVFSQDFSSTSIYSANLNNLSKSGRPLTFKNDTVRLTNPCIAPDESFLIVSTDKLNGYGKADLYISFPDSTNQWTGPFNLGDRVNSPYTDFAPAITPDMKYLLFTSERPGIVQEPGGGRPPGDIYAIELEPILRSIQRID